MQTGMDLLELTFQYPRFLLLMQVRGLLKPHQNGGQGQDRTVDLPLFSSDAGTA
jgi:hypothetical protein